MGSERSDQGGFSLGTRETPSPARDAEAASDWLDAFFAAYYAQRPVNATFVGRHEHDHALPDYSEHGVGDAASAARDLLDRCPDPSHPSLSWPESTDTRLARGYLRCQLWEAGSQHFQGGNPSTYVGEAVFGILSLFLTPFAPIGERVTSAIDRLEAVPRLMDQGRANIQAAPRPWIERASRECRGTLAFLGEGIDWLIHANGLGPTGLRQAADLAASAVAGFDTWIEQELPPWEDVACGPEVFALYLEEGHALETGAEELVRYARDRWSEADARLSAVVRDAGAQSAEDLLAPLRDRHPARDDYYAAYRRTWEAVRSHAEAHDLVTWPDFPIRYVPRPVWARAAAPDLYFLSYRSPAAFDRPPVHDYMVTPIEPDLPPHDRQAVLRANNDSVIKLNHVIHHGGIGHHVQNWHAFRAESRVGRIAAVDCASRIAMFCGGTMAEGWACYATDLMREFGALTPLEEAAELQSRRRMCARAIVDVELHHGRLTIEDAAEFYERNAGMGATAARREAVKNSMFPAAALMYLVGTDAIHDLRRELAGVQGPAFDLGRFHDEFLSHGSVPVSMIAERMTAEAVR